MPILSHLNQLFDGGVARKGLRRNCRKIYSLVLTTA